MTLPSRRKTNWGSQPRRNGAAPTDKPPEPPEFLGTWNWRQADPLETTEAWFERTKRQRTEVIARASNWLRLGQTVKVHFDPQVGGDVAGRVGTVYRLGNPVFADFVYVHFAPSGQELVPRVRLLPLEILTSTE